MYKLLSESAVALREKGFTSSTGAVVFANAADRIPELNIKRRIAFTDILHMPSGLQGEFLLIELKSKPVLLVINNNVAGMNHTLQELIFPLRLMFLLGNRNLFLVNKAVGLNKDFQPGDLVLLDDHISFLKDSPLTGPNIDELGPRFPDMSAPYDAGIQKQVLEIASAKGLKVNTAVYASFPGKDWSVSEIALSVADCAGNTLVPEVITGRHMNMKICGLSVIAENLESPVNFNTAFQLMEGVLAL